MTGISRRNLLKGAAFSAAGVAALGLAGCAPQTEATKADAALAASIFHYNEIPIPALKRELHRQNINVRL